MHLAMWSGPRNLSTALMRSFGSRADTVVVDEPLYAAFLAETGAAHPLASTVIAAHETDWRRVAQTLTGPLPEGAAIFYQKHMAHHLLPSMDREWIGRLTNAFLIREPRRVLASYVDVHTLPTLFDLGYPQQLELFEAARDRTGAIPPVIDAGDVLRDPAGTLSALCGALGIEFDQAMLSWEPGPHPEDGVWAAHWYGSVWQSTGFGPAGDTEVEIPASLEAVATECETIYQQLHAYRLTG